MSGIENQAAWKSLLSHYIIVLWQQGLVLQTDCTRRVDKSTKLQSAGKTANATLLSDHRKTVLIHCKLRQTNVLINWKSRRKSIWRIGSKSILYAHNYTLAPTRFIVERVLIFPMLSNPEFFLFFFFFKYTSGYWHAVSKSRQKCL